jgi:hypothetical protein
VTHTAAYDRFIASMKIGYVEWHDGVPYDLEALALVSPEELAELEALLIQRKDDDWRDAEALAKINSPTALRALQGSLRGPNREVRIRAAELLYASGRLDSLDDVIVEGLRFGRLGEGLAQAERLAVAHPSAAVNAALLQGALCSNDGRAVRFVGILFFLQGKASEPFDWSQRAFFLRFRTADRRERRKAFDEMCRLIGVDGSSVNCAADRFQDSARPWWRFWS